MDLDTRTRMIPAAFIQMRQQRPSHSVLLAGANVAPSYAIYRIVLLLLLFAFLQAENVQAGPGSFTLSNLTPVCDQTPPAGPAVTLNWTQSAGATSYDLYRNGALYTSGLTGLTFY